MNAYEPFSGGFGNPLARPPDRHRIADAFADFYRDALDIQERDEVDDDIRALRLSLRAISEQVGMYDYGGEPKYDLAGTAARASNAARRILVGADDLSAGEHSLLFAIRRRLQEDFGIPLTAD